MTPTSHSRVETLLAARGMGEALPVTTSGALTANRCEIGDARVVLPSLAAETFDCCVTSPPYWGLRDYGVESQIGLEGTPEEYVTQLVSVFDEVRRVLKSSATLWLNLGDSYCSTNKWGGGGNPGKQTVDADGSVPSWTVRRKRPHVPGIKPKDLVGIPLRVALALQAAGWWFRSEVIWNKPNAMPEPVEDRPPRAHEHVFLFIKSERYFYDGAAIREPAPRPRASSDTRMLSAEARGGLYEKPMRRGPVVERGP